LSDLRRPRPSSSRRGRPRLLRQRFRSSGVCCDLETSWLELGPYARNFVPHMRIFWVALLALLAGSAFAVPGDDDFLAAREAFRVGNSARFEKSAARLKGYVLEPYIDYWRLTMRLEQASPEEVRAFLAANRDSPLSERLRNEWL